MDDIGKRLRRATELVGSFGGPLLTEAADEIERLRTENAELVEQIKLMTMSPDEVAAWLEGRL